MLKIIVLIPLILSVLWFGYLKANIRDLTNEIMIGSYGTFLWQTLGT